MDTPSFRGSWRCLLAFAASLLIHDGLAQNSDPASPIPDYYSAGGFAAYRDQLATEDVSEAIDPFSGRVHLSHVDVSIPGNGGFDLNVIRSYNNTQLGVINQSDMGAVGIGWDITFGRVLLNPSRGVCDKTISPSMNSSTNHVVQLPDGSRHILYPANVAPFNTYVFVTSQRWVATCTAGTDGGQGLIISSPDGLKYHMTKRRTSGMPALLVTKITDRYNNTMTVNYAVAGGSLNATVISSVTTSDGRSVEFAYSNQNANNYALESITAGGRTWRYEYEPLTGFMIPSWFLVTVKRPDNSKWEYTYYPDLGLGNPNSYALKTMEYPYGAEAAYTYQNVHFGYAQQTSSIATKTLSGPHITTANWSYQFQAAAAYDQTTVTGPGVKYVYKHVGYLAAANDNSIIWKVGSLISKEIQSSNGTLIQSENYEWDKLKLSTQRLLASGNSAVFNDVGCFGPLQTRRNIVRDGTSYDTVFSNFDTYGNPLNVTETGPAGTRATTLTYSNNATNHWIGTVKTKNIAGIRTITNGISTTTGGVLNTTIDGVKTTYTYTSQGDVATMTDAANSVTTYTSYKRGIAQTIAEPESISITKTVSDAGNVLTIKDGLGYITTYQYDDLNRPTSVVYPIRASVAINWGSSTATVTRGAYVETTNYDGLGRPLKIDRNGIANNYRYDALGRRTFASYPCPTAQTCPGRTYTYDALGRLTKIDNNGAIRSFDYSSNGTVAITNERNIENVHRYDAYGDPDDRWPISVVTPRVTTEMTYNAVGMLQKIKQGGLERTYTYNANQYLASSTDPETGTTLYGRDILGNLKSRQIGSGIALNFQYDKQNRQTVVYSTPGTTIIHSLTTYNKGNSPLTVTGQCTRITYAYDQLGALTSETHQDTCGGPTLTATYGYDDLDHLSTVTYPSGRVIDYAPDLLGRPTKAANYVTSATYHPNGQVENMVYGNGATKQQTLGARQTVATLLAKTLAGNRFVDYTYGYDNANNIKTITDGLASGNNLTLDYDEDDQLTTATGGFGIGGVIYDALGNITRLNLGVGRLYNFTYSANRLTLVTGSKSYVVTYDANGNVNNDGRYQYTYDARNLLISAKP